MTPRGLRHTSTTDGRSPCGPRERFSPWGLPVHSSCRPAPCGRIRPARATDAVAGRRSSPTHPVMSLFREALIAFLLLITAYFVLWNVSELVVGPSRGDFAFATSSAAHAARGACRPTSQLRVCDGHVYAAPAAKRFARQHGVVAGGLAGGVERRPRITCSAWRAASARLYPTPAAGMRR